MLVGCAMNHRISIVQKHERKTNDLFDSGLPVVREPQPKQMESCDVHALQLAN